MERINYTPFLKLKSNEVGAIAALSGEIKDQIIPFFDFPRKEGMTEVSFCVMVSKAAKKVKKLLGESQMFYLDNFDIPDDIQVDALPNYLFVIDEFKTTSFVPVVGIDRTQLHNESIFRAKSAGLIQSDLAAVRLTLEDCEDFQIIETELEDLMLDGTCFKEWNLILDCRMCLNIDIAHTSQLLTNFINSARAALPFKNIVVTGSSVPASITEVAKVGTCSALVRDEIGMYNLIRTQPGMSDVQLGDYTIVSPLYSEIDMPPEMLLNVTAPKVLYSDDLVHHIARGKALKSHPRGNRQYNDIAAQLIGEGFYRGPNYSYGDGFINEKALGIGNQVTPGSILKPTINAHITYMVLDHPSLA